MLGSSPWLTPSFFPDLPSYSRRLGRALFPLLLVGLKRSCQSSVLSCSFGPSTWAVPGHDIPHPLSSDLPPSRQERKTTLQHERVFPSVMCGWSAFPAYLDARCSLAAEGDQLGLQSAPWRERFQFLWRRSGVIGVCLYIGWQTSFQLRDMDDVVDLGLWRQLQAI